MHAQENTSVDAGFDLIRLIECLVGRYGNHASDFEVIRGELEVIGEALRQAAGLSNDDLSRLAVRHLFAGYLPQMRRCVSLLYAIALGSIMPPASAGEGLTELAREHLLMLDNKFHFASEPQPTRQIKSGGRWLTSGAVA